jgi:membrane associated rhomboid family serine protease
LKEFLPRVRVFKTLEKIPKVEVGRAFLLIGVWFLIRIFDQVGALADVQSGGVAYAAHVGGFLFGLVTARVFARSTRPSKW